MYYDNTSNSQAGEEVGDEQVAFAFCLSPPKAKGNFSQLIRRAAGGQAQTVTVHGKPAAVVVSAEEYARLTRRKGKLSSALLCPGLAVEDHDFPRSPDIGRNVEL